MPVSDYFSTDYPAARERFRSACQHAGLSSQDYELSGHTGPDGQALAITVTRSGAASARRALVLISGTHGVEGLAGSGCQVGCLEDRLHEALPPECAFVLIHALNPYGFAWLRRVNEDNVDLNRNFIDFGQPPDAQAYEALHPWLIPEEFEGARWNEATAKLWDYAKTHGMAAFQAALTQGQYSRPEGLFYGGRERTWSARMLQRLLTEHLAGSIERLVVLDLHTGLGPPAYGEPILVPTSPEDGQRASKWFGAEVRDLSKKESVSADLEGTLALGVRECFPGAELTYLGLEFGTLPVPQVLEALRSDHWVHARCGSAAQRQVAQKRMRAAFYSEHPAWQAAVYGRTADFVYRAARALS